MNTPNDATEWNPAELDEIVAQQQGKDAQQELLPPLRSLPRKLAMAEYHLDESLRLVSELSNDPNKDEIVAATLAVLGRPPGGTSKSDYEQALFRAEAHLIAMAQALHSMADVMGKVIWISLGLDSKLSKRIKPWRRYLHTIAEQMQKDDVARRVVDAAQVFLKEVDFRYLADYVNQTKHHCLIDTTHAIDMKDREHGLRIAEFEKSSSRSADELKKWSNRWADEFGENSFHVVFQHVDRIGRKLNDHLRQ